MQKDEPVEPQTDELRNSPIAELREPAAVEATTFAALECYWNDKKYSDGAAVCDAGHRYKCWNGRWVDAGNC